MNSDLDSDSARDAPVCTWCGEPLMPDESERSSRVCDRCARKLHDAGLSDEEIYGARDEG